MSFLPVAVAICANNVEAKVNGDYESEESAFVQLVLSEVRFALNVSRTTRLLNTRLLCSCCASV